jgi:hypothetical protein
MCLLALYFDLNVPFEDDLTVPFEDAVNDLTDFPLVDIIINFEIKYIEIKNK